MNTPPQYDTPWIVDASIDTFQETVIEQSHSLPVVVDFWSHNCQPCMTLMPILEALAKEYDGRFLLVKANAEQLQQAAMAFGVQVVPAVYAVSGGEIVDFFQGAMPEAQVREWIDRQLPSEADELTATAQARLDTDAE